MDRSSYKINCFWSWTERFGDRKNYFCRWIDPPDDKINYFCDRIDWLDDSTNYFYEKIIIYGKKKLFSSKKKFIFDSSTKTILKIPKLPNKLFKIILCLRRECYQTIISFYPLLFSLFTFRTTWIYNLHSQTAGRFVSLPFRYTGRWPAG